MIEEGGHEATRLYSEFEDEIELLKVKYFADNVENVNENVNESANSADDHVESGHEGSSPHSDAGDIIDAGDDVSAVLTMVNNTRGEFTFAESNMMIRGLVKYGEDWVSIAQLIPGRDSTQVRKRYWRMKQSKTWKRIIQRKNEYLATLSGDDSGSSAANGGEFSLLDGDPTSERDTPQGSVLIQSGSSVDAQDAQSGESSAMNIRTGTSTVDASGSANLSTGSDSSSMNSTSTLDQFGSSSSGTMSTATERIEHMLEERRQQALLVSQLQSQLSEKDSKISVLTKSNKKLQEQCDYHLSEVVRVTNRALDLQEYINKIDGDDDNNDVAIEFMEDVEENVARVSTITRHVSESDETESVESSSSVTDFELYIASEAYAEYGGLTATSIDDIDNDDYDVTEYITTVHVSESDETESVESTSSCI